MKLKKSLFNLLIPLANNYYILYNTLNGAIALIDKDVKTCLEEDNYSSIPHNMLRELKRAGFLIPEDLDEVKYYQYLLSKAIYSSHILSFVVLTTYDCNFSCIYCYEQSGGIIAPVYMNVETAQKVADYIVKKAKQIKPDRISIALYGGEPLLNIKAGLLILQEIKRFCMQNSIELNTGLITNGSLMTKEIINELSQYNLLNIQVTVDGIEEVHNKRRPFKNGKGSFSIIMNNILNAVDLLPPKTIVIRSNIDKMNYESYPLFLDYLISVGLRNKVKLGIGIPRGVFPYCTKMQFSEEELSNKIFELWKIAIKKGFGCHIEPGPVLCSAIQENSFLVDPNGDLYKCWALVGKKQYAVGNIYEEQYRPIFYKFVTRSPLFSKKCRQCNILPYCNGGCLYESYYKTGDPFNIICGNIFSKEILEKEILEKIVTLYVIDRYRSILKERGLWQLLMES